MSYFRVPYLYCDYPGCHQETPDYVPLAQPLESGWAEVRGIETHHLCPEHARKVLGPLFHEFTEKVDG